MEVHSVDIEYKTALPNKWQRLNLHVLTEGNDVDLHSAHAVLSALNKRFGIGGYRILRARPAELNLPIILDTYYGGRR